MPARAFARFLRSEYFGGCLLLLATIAAMIMANSSFSGSYREILHGDIGFTAFNMPIHMSVAHWINDGLMMLFFLVVGLEIKREFLSGELSTLPKAALPIICAIGGVIVPALIFIAVNREASANWHGWAIPTATDIAFALGLLAMGSRIPIALKVFLTALAIIDDLFAILIIAIFYGGHITVDPFLFAAGIMFCLFALNLLRVTQIWPYLLLGAVLWVCILRSGLHPTLAGVLLAIMIPVGDTREASPLHRLEDLLHPLSAYFIMPVFALANAGLSFRGLTFEQMLTPLALGIALALFFGKQIGIFLAGLTAQRMRWAVLPEGASMLQFYGVAVLAGVGFTMSLFIGTLAFPDIETGNQVRLGVMGGSLLSALLGLVLLRWPKQGP